MDHREFETALYKEKELPGYDFEKEEGKKILMNRNRLKSIQMKALIVVALTVPATLLTALTTKAGIGTYASWDSVSLNMSQITGMKVATFSIILNILCVASQMIVLRKEFTVRLFLQLPYAIVYGSLTNYFYYHVLVFEFHSYVFRLLACIASIIGVGMALGFLASLGIVGMPIETTSGIFSNRFQIDYGVLRISFDVACTVVSLLLSLVFKLPLAIREGTILALFLLGGTEKIVLKYFRPVSEKLRRYLARYEV